MKKTDVRESKFDKAYNSLPMGEERTNLYDKIWRFRPGNWKVNPNWCNLAYLRLIKKQEEIINYLENKLVRSK